MGVTVKGLARMGEPEIRDLAFRSGTTPAEIGRWIAAAAE